MYRDNAMNESRISYRNATWSFINFYSMLGALDQWAFGYRSVPYLNQFSEDPKGFGYNPKGFGSLAGFG